MQRAQPGGVHVNSRGEGGQKEDRLPGDHGIDRQASAQARAGCLGCPVRKTRAGERRDAAGMSEDEFSAGACGRNDACQWKMRVVRLRRGFGGTVFARFPSTKLRPAWQAIAREASEGWCPWPAVTYFLNYPNLWRF